MRSTLLRRGDSGPRVAAVRAQLVTAGIDAAAPTSRSGVFDDALDRAVRQFQQQRGLTADGVVGPETSRALDGARWRLGDRILRHTPGHLVMGDDVVQLQQRLAALGHLRSPVDGLFGPETEQALRELQRAGSVVDDGTCGPVTLRVLASGAPSSGEGAAADAARTRAGLGAGVGVPARQGRRPGTRLSGRVVVLDPGHGGSDRGAVCGDLAEADVVLDLAVRLEGRLTAAGVSVVLTRGAEQDPPLAERIALAEAVRADLYLSLHCDADDRPGGAPGGGAHGLASSYWGLEGSGVRSPTGARLADLVQRELTSRTPLLDLRSHPRGWDVLRLTRMPAVRIDLGYLSDPGDAALLGDPAVRDTCAEGLLAAVQRLYLPQEDDAVTGSLSLPDVVARSFGEDRAPGSDRP